MLPPSVYKFRKLESGVEPGLKSTLKWDVGDLNEILTYVPDICLTGIILICLSSFELIYIYFLFTI